MYYGYSAKVYEWINRFVTLEPLAFELWSYVESERQFFSYPIHEDDIARMSQADKIRHELATRDVTRKHYNFEDYWIGSVGRTLYDMFVNKYSKKMWSIPSNTLLDTFSWSAKDNPINTGSRHAYKGSHLAYPVGPTGYNPYFEKLLDHPRIRTIFGQNVSSFDLDAKTAILADGTRLQGDVLISSIPIEELCENRLGELPYAGRKFIPFVLPTKEICPGNIRFLHYTGEEKYTRIVEYKKLTKHEADDTLMVMELPSNDKEGGKLYPYMIRKYMDRAKEYQRTLPQDVYSTGRLGTYRYSTIEQTIAQAFGTLKMITGRSIKGMENEFFNIGDVNIIKERKAG